MSLSTKQQVKSWGKKIAGIMFALLFLVNIKILLKSDSPERSDISLSDLNFNMSSSTFAAEESDAPWKYRLPEEEVEYRDVVSGKYKTVTICKNQEWNQCYPSNP